MPEIFKIMSHAQLEHAIKRSYSQPVVILVTTTGCYPCCYAESTIKSRAERSPHAYYATINSATFPWSHLEHSTPSSTCPNSIPNPLDTLETRLMDGDADDDEGGDGVSRPQSAQMHQMKY
ncbi:hypothetical protein TcWFU_001074 [Taenia crassiceps]|uniref:Uncharacterized protein n=1 Tax=Taenia crassiceps TaxID=6207 RepID=A0ABR4Q0F3_9CEST